MNNDCLDTIGGILWYTVFIAPFLSVFFVWRFIKIQKAWRIMLGILLGLIISLICYFVSLGIIFRNGMGPV